MELQSRKQLKFTTQIIIWYVKKGRSMDDMEVKETELKPIDVDVRGYTNRFECQMCLAVIYSEICLKNSDYEYCPYCGRKIKD